MPDEIVKPAQPDRQPAERTCQVCGEPLRLRRVIQCSRCKTLHHLECWRFNKGCAMYACGSRSWEDAPAAEAPVEVGEFERKVGTPPERILGWLSILYAAMAGVGTAAAAAGAGVAVATLPGALTLGLLWCAHRYGLCRERIEVDPASKVLGWRLEGYGRVLRRNARWLAAAEIVELHLHTAGAAHGMTICALYALLLDGSRRLVHWNSGEAGVRVRADMDRLVDQLAVFADCTVRRIEGHRAPPAAELAEAIAQRRLALATPSPAAPVARELPPPVAEDPVAPAEERDRRPGERTS